MEDKILRNGYTTGSCAAAAAKAAAFYLLTGICLQTVDITLPNGSEASLSVEKVSGPESCFRVQKDAGDDPDVTDKTYIQASCRLMTPREKAVYSDSGSKDKGTKGYLMEGEPLIFIDGGWGIGIVTLDGLPCPAGHYAINPVPRMEIARAVREALSNARRDEDLYITISAPEGGTLSERTFNPRLGIIGGISILGTSGIVKPMSEEAVLDTIRLQIRMRAAAGRSGVIFTPGNYGETFLKERFEIPEGTAVQISNFVRDSVLMARDEGMKKILFAGHIGKLIKVAAGMPNTHSKYGDNRMDTLLSLLENITAGQAFAFSPDDDLKKRIADANTTDDALLILSDACGTQAAPVIAALLKETAAAVKRQMESWADGSLLVEVITFSREGDTGMSAGAADLLASWKETLPLGRNTVDL